MLDLPPNKIRDLFDKDLSKVYEELGNMAVSPAVLLALHTELSIEGSIEQKECDLAKKFFAQCRYDKTEDYIETGKFRKINGIWNIQFVPNFNLENSRGNCAELASKLGTLLQLAFPQRMLMLVQDKKNIGGWNHYAIMDFTKALEEFGLKFDLSECKDMQSLFECKIRLLTQVKKTTMSLELTIFDPSFSVATKFANYLKRQNFNIEMIDLFEKMRGLPIDDTLQNNNYYFMPLYKKKTEGVSGFGVSLVFDNALDYPKFAVLNGEAMEFVNIDKSAFNNPLLQKAGLDHDDIEMLLESVRKMDIVVERKFFGMKLI